MQVPDASIPVLPRRFCSGATDDVSKQTRGKNFNKIIKSPRPSLPGLNLCADTAVCYGFTDPDSDSITVAGLQNFPNC